MKRILTLAAALALCAVPAAAVTELSFNGRPDTSFPAATPTGTSYMLTDHWGGTWSDAEKPDDTNLMCWAASASNVLAWTGWGKVAGMTTTDDIFAYTQNYWSDGAGLMHLEWKWWFDGSGRTSAPPGYSVIYQSGGGAFYPAADINSYRKVYQGQYAGMMQGIDDFFHEGRAVAIGIYGGLLGGAHAVTIWGFNYDPNDPDHYVGIWITDSDDDKPLPGDPPVDPASLPNALRYYEIEYRAADAKWYLLAYGSQDDDYWWIGWVDSMLPIPEPATFVGVGLALCALRTYIRKRRAAD